MLAMGKTAFFYCGIFLRAINRTHSKNTINQKNSEVREQWLLWPCGYVVFDVKGQETGAQCSVTLTIKANQSWEATVKVSSSPSFSTGKTESTLMVQTEHHCWRGSTLVAKRLQHMPYNHSIPSPAACPACFLYFFTRVCQIKVMPEN